MPAPTTEVVTLRAALSTTHPAMAELRDVATILCLEAVRSADTWAEVATALGLGRRGLSRLRADFPWAFGEAPDHPESWRRKSHKQQT